MEYVKGPDGMFYKYFARSVNAQKAYAKCVSEGGLLVQYETQVSERFNLFNISVQYFRSNLPHLLKYQCLSKVRNVSQIPIES